MLIVSMSLGCVKRSGDATAMASCNFVLGVFAVLSIFINCAGMAPALTETFPLYGIAQKVMVKNFSGFWFNQVLFGAIGGANLIASNSSGGAIPDFGTGIDFSNAAGRAVMYGVILGGLYGPMMLFNADGLMDLYGGLFKDTQGNEAMTWAKLTMLNWGLLLVQNSLMGIAARAELPYGHRRVHLYGSLCDAVDSRCHSCCSPCGNPFLRYAAGNAKLTYTINRSMYVWYGTSLTLAASQRLYNLSANASNADVIQGSTVNICLWLVGAALCFVAVLEADKQKAD